jgi:hypothetical protein
MNRLRLSGVAAILGLVALTASTWASTAQAAGPSVLLVGPPGTGGAKFTSVQDAVNHAKPGDWVLIAPGVYHEKGWNPTDGSRPAEVYVTVPNLHIRGMNRDTVIIDGTNFSRTQAAGTARAGSPACSSDPALQDPGVKDSQGNTHTREGIMVWKASGVSIENLTSCNSLDNEIWWNYGDGGGVEAPMALHGDYISATSTFYKDSKSPSAQYGIFTSNVEGPGVIDHSYASNMTDSAYYIGACRNCNVTLERPHAENSALGLSSTNAGGNFLIENGEWDLNRTGMVSNAQNNDDYPSPQYGQCVPPSTPPPGAGPNSCTVWRYNRIHDNNNPNTPGSGLTSVSAVGAGVELAATQHISVVNNVITNQGAYGVVTHDFPDPESGPANCHGGVPIDNPVQFVCNWYSRGNYVANNQFKNNGGFGNPTNGDIANQASGAAWAPTDSYGGAPDPNCFKHNADSGGAIKEWPPGLQEAPCPPGLSETPVLTAQLVCDTGFASLFTQGVGLTGGPACPPGATYPQHDGKCTAPAVLTPPGDTTNGVCFLPLSYTLSATVSPPMPTPCAGVPSNAYCRRT